MSEKTCIKRLIIDASINGRLKDEMCFLRRSDIRIVTACTKEEALELHMNERADLIILELDLAEMSGERFCEIIRENEELRTVSLVVVHQGGSAERDRAARCRANAIIETCEVPAVMLEKIIHFIHVPKRESYRSPISVRVEGESSAAPFLGYAENISVSGMLFYSERGLRRGEMILCSFILPDSTHVRTKAEIVRITDKFSEHETNSYGIRFVGLSEEFRNAVEAYVQSSKKQG